jgi:hypothetical protein
MEEMMDMQLKDDYELAGLDNSRRWAVEGRRERLTAATVKILYTFDFGKTNCLVRPQELFSVPTIPLSPTNVVGMIDLSSIIRAVINARSVSVFCWYGDSV